jgi:hypothetical protein
MSVSEAQRFDRRINNESRCLKIGIPNAENNDVLASLLRRARLSQNFPRFGSVSA